MDGTALGVGEDGRGIAITERQVLVTTIAIAVIGCFSFASRPVDAAFCAVAGIGGFVAMLVGGLGAAIIGLELAVMDILKNL